MIDTKMLQNVEFFNGKDMSHSFDNLTKVLAREATIEYINWLINNKKSFSYAMVDIDNFKNINDTYGHMVGDVALVETATYLRNCVEGSGIVGRYGGDEFMLVFENVQDYDAIWQYGHKIDTGISGVNIEGYPRITLTVSMGIARYPLDARDYDTLMLIADKALYRAKAKGRNCFIIYLPEKHGNIDPHENREKKATGMTLVKSIFDILTASDNLGECIVALLKNFVSVYLFDHICIESENRLNFSTVHELSSRKNFDHIPLDVIGTVVHATDYAGISNVRYLNRDVCAGLIEECGKQGISSVLYCRIAAFGIDYGYIRVDAIQTSRIWQNLDMTMVLTAAQAIGLLLYDRKLTLEDFPKTQTVEVGAK